MPPPASVALKFTFQCDECAEYATVERQVPPEDHRMELRIIAIVLEQEGWTALLRFGRLTWTLDTYCPAHLPEFESSPQSERETDA